ncbi:MAG: fibronectin type III domain-containing protein [Candidatus Kapabacteria bacterium]|nr:fibronectin type III domain-containing protein [Candidatus Kapabacteria bacterium]
MANTYFPSKDADFVAWLANYLTVANANLTAIGLIAGDLTPISTLQPTYSTNLLDVEAKKAAFASAVETKDATKESIIEKVRITVNKIQANPAVTPALKALLGISTREGGSYPQHPIPPADLIAVLLPDGTIELSWNRNGNAPSIKFVIEYNQMGIAGWQLLDIVTKTTYIHAGMPLGHPVQYQIKARKGTETSPPSNMAVVG